MPTGYTAGILDGEIKTFPEFAKICMRQFGAVIHMRDEPLSKAWEPRVPTDYHLKEIEKAKQLLKSAKASDKVVCERRRTELLSEKEYYLKKLEEIRLHQNKINEILAEAVSYTPPTSEHENFKAFMIQQLTETRSFDCNPKYYKDKLVEIDESLRHLHPEKIRDEIRAKAEKDIAYHEEEHTKEVRRCNQSNAWVQMVLVSLENQNQTA